MRWLDGRELETALSSLAVAAGTDAKDLAAAMAEVDDRLTESGIQEPPETQVPRQVFAGIGADVDALTFDGAYYFHGTHVVDPATFRRRGIMPLNEILGELWTSLYKLVADEQTPEEWRAFRSGVEHGDGGDFGQLYRFKTAGAIHFGPHGTFVREVLLNPVPPAHDYLGGSEIVEDIAHCYATAYGGDLMARFCAATKPCIVTFGLKRVEPSAMNSVFWFAYSMLRYGEAGFLANGGIALAGEPVPPQKIAEVVVAEPVPGERRLYRPDTTSFCDDQGLLAKECETV